MSSLSSSLQAYYRAVERAIPCSGKQKKRYLSDILQSLTNLQNEQPDAGYETAILRIGAPENLAEDFKETISASSFSEQRRHTARFKVIAAAVLVLAAILIGIFGSFYYRYKEAMAGDFVVEIYGTVYPEDWTDEEIAQYEQSLMQKLLEEN